MWQVSGGTGPRARRSSASAGTGKNPPFGVRTWRAYPATADRATCLLTSLFVSFGLSVVVEDLGPHFLRTGCMRGESPPLREGEAPSKQPQGCLGGEVHKTINKL